MMLATPGGKHPVAYSAIGKILVAIAEIAAVVVLSIYAPGIGTALGVSAFVVTAVGSVIITIGFSLLSALLFKPQAPGIDAAKYNVRIPEPPRYISAGIAANGGGVVFGEFDGNKNFWYIIIHCDSILTSALQYYFDSEPITFDGQGTGEGYVLTDDFCLTQKGDPYTGGENPACYFYVWTRTYTETNPVPPPVNELQAAFPNKWQTVSHLLVGTTYSVVKCSPIKLADRYKVYRWRGVFGLGEPGLSIAGQWSNMYDPRDPTQVLGDRTTYKPSRNSALIWAWFRTHRWGRNKPESTINWDQVAQQATICDQTVVGAYSTQVRYECGTTIIDSKQRYAAEQEIMQSCDGQLVFDETGSTWLRVGYYYEPTLLLNRNRDIIAMMSSEAQDGESVTQGVIVRFTDPSANYTAQPSAAWYNPNYYVAGAGNTFLTVDVLTIQNHNQAMRVAKAIGMRSQPIQKIGPTVGLRGLRALEERIVNISYDNTFAGDYEICTPVEVDESGYFCSLGLVPIDANRFTLLPGEEKPKPVVADAAPDSNEPGAPTSVIISYSNGTIQATFAPPSDADTTYDFQYQATGASSWSDMTVNMADDIAYSGMLASNIDYKVQYRGRSSGGYVSDWTLYDLGIMPATENNASVQSAIFSSYIVEVQNGGTVMTMAADGTLTITNNTRRYNDGHADVVVTGAMLATGLAAGTTRSVGYDDPTRVGGAVTYNLYAADTDAHASAANPGRHYMGYVTVPASGSPPSGGGGGGTGGGNGRIDTR